MQNGRNLQRRYHDWRRQVLLGQYNLAVVGRLPGENIPQLAPPARLWYESALHDALYDRRRPVSSGRGRTVVGGVATA